MISHAVLGTADFDRALGFYRAVMPVLGARERFCERTRPWAGWEPATGGRPLLLIAAPFDRRAHAAGNGQMVALAAPDRASVARAHAAALAHGGTCEGLPGLRPEYHPNYFGAYVRDPDGNKLGFACHAPEPAPLGPRAVVAEWVARFNRADVDGLADLYAEDAVNHQVVQDPLHGREAIRRFFAMEFGRATMTCLPEQVLEDGEWAILEWRDPKGLRGCGFFRVVDGRIAFQRGYFDRLAFFRQQGIDPSTANRS